MPEEAPPEEAPPDEPPEEAAPEDPLEVPPDAPEAPLEPEPDPPLLSPEEAPPLADELEPGEPPSSPPVVLSQLPLEPHFAPGQSESELHFPVSRRGQAASTRAVITTTATRRLVMP